MTFTLHKEVGDGLRNVPLPEADVGLTPTHHAEAAADDADSASCLLDGLVLPDRFRLVDGDVLVAWSDAAPLADDRAAAVANGKAVMKGEVFEVDVTPIGEVVKVAARVPYDMSHDLCVVVDPRDGTLITVWANETGDEHESLDASRYDTPADVPALA